MGQSFHVTEVCSGSHFECDTEQSVLAAMEQQHHHCVPVGCRGGGCGLCLVRVVRGEFDCGRMSARHVPPEIRAQGRVLACRLYPRSDLAIERHPETVVSGSNPG
ncbi:Ferredoxin [Geopseudomonas sagittaria]|jgi:ferredoxin|uniref:Ferredoxin n=2 Tax=Pseudomonadaceae TaxID=135621 RepID=A0A1H1QQC8_9PSED|nr:MULTISPECIES: 2Fe-2S iron-sulfur cluster-binding protein [Pseudomonas]SDS25680.1 Ferredoxin [Pseudomonas oryzae]SFP36676.1 Ferredoxin [Pseudomonas sagittaria]